MQSIARSERNIAHRIIEEFMLAANEAVAQYLEQRGTASLHRVHEKPDPQKVLEFEELAHAFGYSMGIPDLAERRIAVRHGRVQPPAQSDRKRGGRMRPMTVTLPESGEVNITPHHYQRLTAKIAGKPEERILSYLMLRSLKQARYAASPLGHFALAAGEYTHFTSPIRRYPDLIVHRILKEVLRKGNREESAVAPPSSRSLRQGGDSPDTQSLTPDADVPSPWSKRRDHKAHREDHAPLSGPIPLEELHSIAEESSQSERRADDAERELMEWKKVKFMQERLGEDFNGLITSVTKFGFFVELTDLFVEGLVPLNTLIDDRYTYHENTREIIGQHSRKTYRIGQQLRVLVDRIDPVEKKVNFAVVEEERPKPAKAKRHKRK